MKKVTALLLCVTLVITMFACKEDDGQTIEVIDNPQNSVQTAVPLESEHDPAPSANQATELENIPDPEKDTSSEAVPEDVSVPITTLESLPPPEIHSEPEPAPPPEVTITEVSETVWATTAVNVRAGASAECERYGGLWTGDSVLRTGLTDNGWSRVEFEGKIAYVCSDYLSNTDPNMQSEAPIAEEIPSAETAPLEAPTEEAPPSDSPTTGKTSSTDVTPAPEPAPEPPAADTIDYIRAFSDSVSYDNIVSSLYTLTKEIGSRRVGTQGNTRAREYIVSKLSSYGFSENDETIYRQGYNSWGLYTENVIARVTTATPSPRYLIISAHFDTVRGTEGAVDNASGTAALLETARVVKQSGIDFGLEIRFCFFSAEEDGYVGAKEYISRQSADQLSRTECILNIDMAGYDNSPRPVALVVSTKGDPSVSDWNPAQPNIVSGSIVDAYYHLGDINASKYYSPTNAGKHDLVPFWNAGIRGATISWREIDFSRSYGNDLGIAAPEWIHTANDCYENLDDGSVYTTTKLIAGSVAALWQKL